MRSGPPQQYPVDRYLVESSNKIEMVDIIDDELWNPSPALRPEDELILRRLHDMLHATAEDLRQLTGELATHKQPGLQLRTTPVPLDEEFNEKVHIQELVDAKFHNKTLVDKHPISTPKRVPNPNLNVTFSKSNVNTGVQVDSKPTVKQPTKVKNLEITRTRILEIDERLDKNAKNKLNNGKVINQKVVNKPPAVAYNEILYKHEEPKGNATQNKFKVQNMPSINIRSELKEQKVLQLDIYPEMKQNIENSTDQSNVAVVAVAHIDEAPKENPQITLTSINQTQRVNRTSHAQPTTNKTQPVRKVTKLLTSESSCSTNNISSDTQHKIKTQQQIKSVIRSSPKPSARDRSKIKKSNNGKKELEKRTFSNLDDWKKKLNTVYGRPSSSKSNKSTKKIRKPSLQTNISSVRKLPEGTPVKNYLNNAEYIPYTKLTLGGARLSDIEREISNIRDKQDLPLSPILDKILSSKENSFHKNSPRKSKKKKSPRIFTTSDENLLEEIIDLENKVSNTLDKNVKLKVKKDKPEKAQPVTIESKEDEDKDSYVDDFEEEKSDNTEAVKNNVINTESENNNESGADTNRDSCVNDDNSDHNETQQNPLNKTYVKRSNLSIKNSVDIFEFVHSVERQDTSTQSNTTRKISLKETQTSPRNDRPNIQPIHNDLWPIDPQGQIENMFKLEKDFIKKLILEEYGDVIEKNIAKPSTSNDKGDERINVASYPKLTQTSPARVKSVMTSPSRTKTRTTSPFLSVTVDHQTSPMIVVTNEQNLSVEVENDEDGISINLSSPRFSLRLPQSSREVLSNLEGASLTSVKSRSERKENNFDKPKTFRKTTRKSPTSSSSSEVENSSEISSLGEVKFKLKRRYKKRVSSISESSETSSVSKTSSDLPSVGIIPLRSEGEVSFKQTMRKVSNKTSRSEGETSLGRIK